MKENRSHKNNKPRFGWVGAGNGWFFAPNDFAHDTAFITPEYFKFAERMRARWDLLEYIQTVLRQWHKKD